MTLRVKVLLYLTAIHLVFAASAFYFLWDRRIWLLGVEALFAASIWAGVRLFQSIFGPLQLIRTGIQFLKETNFSTRFREIGQPEMDELTSVYNKMVDHLREERIRVREQHHFLDQVIQASPSGILTFDYEGRVATVNPAAERIFQARAEELLGSRLEATGTPFARAVAEVAGGESRVLPLEGVRRVKCQKSRFLDRGFPRDFVMLEELTEELRRAEKAAYEKIIRMMSHEINNSIGASNSLLESCLNYSGQLREEDRGDFETALGVAISRTRHLNAFVKSYADVIRLPRPEPRPCDVKQLLGDIAYLMKAECQRRNIAWNWDADEAPGPLPMDKNQMEQVFLNVLKNAMDAIGGSGAITVRLRGRPGRGLVTIEDTGCGFTPEVKAQLFTPFFSTKENGRGIGLTMVQEILTQHGFRFSLDAAPGGPTQFTIWF